MRRRSRFPRQGADAAVDAAASEQRNKRGCLQLQGWTRLQDAALDVFGVVFLTGWVGGEVIRWTSLDGPHLVLDIGHNIIDLLNTFYVFSSIVQS